MTLTHVPTSHDFLEEAKRTLNLAADLVFGFVVEHDVSFGGLDDEDKGAKEYHNKSQYIFRNAINILYLSIEQSMKSRICQVSPYLLLEGPRSWPSVIHTPLSFGKFRTINASDLPRAISLFCSQPLTPRAVEIFEELRIKRNEISHTYSADSNIDILYLLEKIFISAKHIFEFDMFFPIRLQHLNNNESNEIYPDYTTNEAAYEFQAIQKFIGVDRMFDWLDVPKSKLVICGACTWSGTDWVEQPPTASLDGDSTFCFLCGETTNLLKRHCWSCDKITHSSSQAGYCIECGNRVEVGLE